MGYNYSLIIHPLLVDNVGDLIMTYSNDHLPTSTGVSLLMASRCSPVLFVDFASITTW